MSTDSKILAYAAALLTSSLIIHVPVAPAIHSRAWMLESMRIDFFGGPPLENLTTWMSRPSVVCPITDTVALSELMVVRKSEIWGRIRLKLVILGKFETKIKTYIGISGIRSPVDSALVGFSIGDALFLYDPENRISVKK